MNMATRKHRGPLERWFVLAAFAALQLSSAPVQAGSFDAWGHYVPDPNASGLVSFEGTVDRFIPDDNPPECLAPGFTMVTADDALEGAGYIQLEVFRSAETWCFERFSIASPSQAGAYRATVWFRHGTLDAQLTGTYPADEGSEAAAVKLFPTGRTTSDGWVELASNPLSIDGTKTTAVYLRVYNYADVQGVDMDAFELVPAGEFVGPQACSGVGDPACSSEQTCVYNFCRHGPDTVPPLPADGLRDDMVDVMQSQLRVFFGGRKTRLDDLPEALQIIESIRYATSPWAFWNGWAKAIRRLHDWHTTATSSMRYRYPRQRRLNLCFIEGQADVSSAYWPSDPRFKDILVSHTGDEATHGIGQGDHLVAVDGVHPIEWALGLLDVDWGWHQACDSEVFTEFATRMRGLIVAYATNFTIIHCDQNTGSCNPVPETLVVTDLPEDNGSQVNCDNRPAYHFKENNPGPEHHVGWDFFRGPIADTTTEEAIYGMVWDTLYGGGDPEGWVNSNISAAIDDFKANARGVILDHRDGHGGTMDAASNLTRLVRPVSVPMVFYSPISLGGYDGPATAAEGVSIYNDFLSSDPFTVGDADYDPSLPVALILHEDGSASDIMPFGMKGAAKVRLFGPHPTAGAFSTYYNFWYYGGVYWQFATGDSIAADGQPLIGHGVAPDQVVDQLQTDLLAGKDSLHEAALAWVRANLKPLGGGP